MIVSWSDLEQHRGSVAMVDGAFDPLHEGHVEYFRQAAELGVPVLCNLASDAYVTTKHTPLLPAAARAAVIDELRSIDFVHVNEATTEAALEQLRPKYYVKGKDWEGRLPQAQLDICKEHGIEVVYLDAVLNSSSEVLRRFTGAPRYEAQVDAFEDFVHNQPRGNAEEFDEAYFVSDWRAHGNSYSLETRREIEGRNPALIKEVFTPEKVLDAGCGPGALMSLLAEQGVVADGLDFSPETKEIAPPEVGERISIGSITAAPLPDQSYDLVICREVLEHLAVADVQRAVSELCRLSSRYVYVTTRFHPSPDTLFDVATEFDVDPTHITLLNKDLMRLMFVLQGFRRRADLEQKMDWLDKRRVLIYERAA